MTVINSFLSISNASQLAEFCAIMIPCIWAGSFKPTILLSPKRHAAFKLFVQKVLKATQISCTCMVLALHYIQRLRTAYPSIRASIGSEVRLFTTALVLANKYLDDNTFTNKTWSEVSSIPVNELNIMEMEFLSALDYTIHIPHLQFFEWSNTCQQWWTTIQLTSTTTTTTTTQSLKRSVEYDSEQQQYKKRNISTLVYHHQPIQLQPQLQQPSLKRSCDYIEEGGVQQQQRKKFHWDQLYYPSTTNHIVCKPILSWSSSVSALSSSKYNNNNQTSYYLTTTNN